MTISFIQNTLSQFSSSNPRQVCNHLTGAKKYYDLPSEERSDWLQKWLKKHPECAQLAQIVSNDKVKNYVDAGESVMKMQGIELAYLGGVLKSLLPKDPSERKR